MSFAQLLLLVSFKEMTQSLGFNFFQKLISWKPCGWKDGLNRVRQHDCVTMSNLGWISLPLFTLKRCNQSWPTDTIWSVWNIRPALFSPQQRLLDCQQQVNGHALSEWTLGKIYRHIYQFPDAEEIYSCPPFCGLRSVRCVLPPKLLSRCCLVGAKDF